MIKISKKKSLAAIIFLLVHFILSTNVVLAVEQVELASKTKPLTPIESLMPMLLGLVVILVIIFSLAYLFRKFSNFGLSSKNIQIIETQMIGAKEKLVIVQVQEQQFLIGVTGQNISQLGELKKPIQTSKQFEDSVNDILPNSVFSNRHPDNNFSSIISKLIKGEPVFSKSNAIKRNSIKNNSIKSNSIKSNAIKNNELKRNVG